MAGDQIIMKWMIRWSWRSTRTTQASWKVYPLWWLEVFECQKIQSESLVEEGHVSFMA